MHFQRLIILGDFPKRVMALMAVHTMRFLKWRSFSCRHIDDAGLRAFGVSTPIIPLRDRACETVRIHFPILSIKSVSSLVIGLLSFLQFPEQPDNARKVILDANTCGLGGTIVFMFVPSGIGCFRPQALDGGSPFISSLWPYFLSIDFFFIIKVFPHFLYVREEHIPRSRRQRNNAVR